MRGDHMVQRFADVLDRDDELTLSSPEFEPGGPLPDWCGFVNENENPPLDIEHVPDEAAALFVEMVHPEAAEVVDHWWIHWLAWGIDPDIGHIPRGWDGADSTQGYNDFLRQGYGGPSPPPETTETYRFRVYALDTDLDLPPHTRRARIASTIGLEAKILAADELTGTYSADQGTVFETLGPRGLRP